jgi:protein phosphatase 1 regulatory subunit 10
MPSAVDPFAEIVKAMKLKKEPLSNSPANVPTASGNGAKGVASGGIVGGKGGRRKNVTWAPGEGLVQIKYIERAVYDDDMKDVRQRSVAPSIGLKAKETVEPNLLEQGTHGTSLRDLDRGEGAALHQQGLEEAIDWSEPQGEQTFFVTVIEGKLTDCVLTFPPFTIRSSWHCPANVVCAPSMNVPIHVDPCSPASH